MRSRVTSRRCNWGSPCLRTQAVQNVLGDILPCTHIIEGEGLIAVSPNCKAWGVSQRHSMSPTNVQKLARDPAGLLRRKEQDDVGHVLRLSDPAQRDLRR